MEPHARLTARNLIVGLWAAVATPARIRRDLNRLLSYEKLPVGTEALDAPGGMDASVRVAHFLIRALSKLPGRTWRDTCLYRSVAECLVLRRAGLPAKVCLGVRRDVGSGGSLEAHAWVELSVSGGDRGTAAPAAMTRLASAGGAPADGVE